MKALVIDATGAVGKDLVRMLLEDKSFERVDVFVRRQRRGARKNIAAILSEYPR